MSTPNIMTSPISRFNAAIDTCRNILRKEGITGMDSMKHLTLYILARALTKEECKRLSINPRFAWENFMELAEMDSKRQECFDLLKQNGDSLINNLDAVFGTANFNFKLNSPDNHRAILKVLNSIDLNELEGTVDILGTVYENHLGSGSNKSAMRDLGQFFTDRRVCSYMTSLCKPKVFPDHRAESVLDPTMGTAGFLTAYVKYLKDSGQHVDWSKMQMDVAGFDIDEFVMSVGRINMYLSTGVIFDRIAHRDTLHNDVGESHERLKFKNILANMPFGVKGLKFVDCCKRVKELKCDGTKSEPLFLNLMMAALDDGGRCAVVVPDGVLVNNSKQHNSTRKYLLDHFELKRVIKMKGQFFSNTGIQPSILFFENTGKPTSAVEFWDVEQNKEGGIDERMVIRIPCEKFDDAYSFDMRRYQESLNPAVQMSGFPMVELGTFIQILGGKRRTVQEEKNNGVYDFITCSVIGSTRIDIADFTKPAVIINSINGSGKCRPYYSERYSTTTNNIHFTLNDNASNINLKYVHKYLDLSRHLLEEGFIGSNQKKINQEYIKTIKIPIPPLAIQEEIVAVLDNIYSSGASASTLIQNLKSQMSAIVRSVSQRGYEQKKLGDICEFNKNIHKHDTSFGKEIGKYPFYTGAMNNKLYTDQPDIHHHVIIMNRTNGAGKCNLFIDTNCAVAGQAMVFYMKDKNVDSLRYIYYYLQSFKTRVEEGYIGSNHKNISNAFMEAFKIPIPPLSVQQEILAKLTEMEAEIKMLEQLVSKTEERAKYVLESYLTTAAAPSATPVHTSPKKKKPIVVSDEEEIVFDS